MSTTIVLSNRIIVRAYFLFILFDDQKVCLIWTRPTCSLLIISAKMQVHTTVR